MSDHVSMNSIAARLGGLRQAMEAVMQGSSEDHGKWAGVNEFVQSYCDLALQYVTLTGDRTVKLYDTSKLQSPFDMVWPQQKRLFDSVYANTMMLFNVVTQMRAAPIGPIYNLFVSGLDGEWSGAPFQIDHSRCVREYTARNLTDRFGMLDTASIAELKRAPCLFAYEIGCKQAPRFGYIREIVQRQGQVRIEYDVHQVEPFLTADALEQMTFELDIGKLELYRTHWAVKEVNLPKELHTRGITLPSSVRDVTNAVDISRHFFDVALSFPGETRPLVEEIAHELERQLGPNSYFYDNNYVSQLAQPSLDTILHGIYTRAILDVVFLSANYQKKDWCGVEFRAVKGIIFQRQGSRVMFVRTDDGEVDGVFKTDGYVDARTYEPAKIAEFICERLDLLQQNSSAS